MIVIHVEQLAMENRRNFSYPHLRILAVLFDTDVFTSIFSAYVQKTHSKTHTHTHSITISNNTFAGIIYQCMTRILCNEHTIRNIHFALILFHSNFFHTLESALSLCLQLVNLARSLYYFTYSTFSFFTVNVCTL